MEAFSVSLAICAGNSPVTGEFPAQRPVTRSFEVFFDLRLKKRLSKQSWGWWFETLSRPLWRHCNVWSMIALLLFITAERFVHNLLLVDQPMVECVSGLLQRNFGFKKKLQIRMTMTSAYVVWVAELERIHAWMHTTLAQQIANTCAWCGCVTVHLWWRHLLRATY